MTEIEKAGELVQKFLPIVGDHRYVYSENVYIAKQCAIIAVDEILSCLSDIPYGINYLQRRDYWEGVKEELNK